MNRIRSINARVTALQIVLALCCAWPVVAQTNNNTTTTTTIMTTDEQIKAANQELLNADKFQNPYNGMGEPIPVRKDAWTWYWNEKAHIDVDPQDKARFWGNDVISDFFRNISNSFVIPFWNGAMEYDFIRAGVLLIIAGMLLGLGASVFLQKDKEK